VLNGKIVKDELGRSWKEVVMGYFILSQEEYSISVETSVSTAGLQVEN
jgi:hypothetical protein